MSARRPTAETGHIYGTVTCGCADCEADRVSAARAGIGWLTAGMSALEEAKGHYPVTTREWRALDLAAQRLQEHLRWRERHGHDSRCRTETHPGTSPTSFRCTLLEGHGGEHDFGEAYRTHKASFVTFDVVEGQLVRYWHDRPESAAVVEDRSACLKLLGFEEYHTGGNCMALRIERAGGDYLLVTDDASIPTNDDPEVTVGAFNDATGSTEDFGGEECECFPSASNEVLYERIICWLGAESRAMKTQGYGGTAA